MIRYDFLPIVAISPRNGYFTRENIGFAIDKTLVEYGRVAVMVMDTIAAWNWQALGYDVKISERKARLDGNNYKNRVYRHCQFKGYTKQQVNILNWTPDINSSSIYQEYLKSIWFLYINNSMFRNDIRQATRSFIENAMSRVKKYSERIDDIEVAVDIACQYIISEIAFFDSAYKIYSESGVNLIYHRPFEVYENYVIGKYTPGKKSHMGFHIITTGAILPAKLAIA